jgi:hypothetical protein
LTDCDLVPASNLTSIRVFAAFVTVVAACAIAVSLATSGSTRWEVLLVLAAAAWIAESRGMPLNSIELSVSFIPIVLAAVAFGPAAGGLVGLAGMLGDRRGPVERFSIYASTRAIAGVVGGAAALVVAHAIGRSTLLDVLAATLVAGLGYVTIDLLSTMVVGHMRGHVSPRQVWQQLRAAEAMTMALYTPLTALYAFAYGVAGAWVMAFIAIPLLAAHLSYSLYARQSQLIDQLTTTNARLGEANQHLRRVNLSFAAAMVRALDARDAWTLNDDEWAEMRRHSEIGANILIEVEGYSEVARIVRSHHERFDGAGYPDGLAREEIPLLARIIAVADAYNAMTSTRPYRNAMAPDVAIQQLVNGRGSQFQVDLVDAFVRVLQRESDSYRLGLLADFSLESMQHPELSPPAVPLRAAVA